jgi:hypothetical protein
MRKAIQEYYRALNLSPGATPFEIRRAYRQLIRRWHPDFFKPGSPMQTTAEDITKETNEAFEQLYKKKLYRKFPPTVKSAAGSEEPSSETFDDDAGARPEDPKPAAPPLRKAARRAANRGPAAPEPKTARKKTMFAIRALRRWPWGKTAIFIGLILAGLAVRRTLPASSPELAAAALNRRAADSGSVQAAVTIPVAAADNHPRAEAVPPGPGPEKFAQPRESLARSARIETPAPFSYRRLLDYSPAQPEAALSAGPAAPDEIVDEMQALLDTFGIGDSKARVLSIQGAPDEARESVFRYGSSLVYFDEKGQVRGWSDRRPHLRVRVWPTIDQVSFDTFAPGSSRSDVIRAMGRPTAFNRFDYRYGSSVIRFENDRVIDWNEGDTPLREFTLPALPAFIDLDHH